MPKVIISDPRISDHQHSQQNVAHTTCLSWPSIFAGLAVTTLTFLILTVLGAAFGGFAASDLEGFKVLSWSAAVWTVLTGIISLFAGAYATSRISNYISSQVGVVQALTIAALFFGIMIWSGTTFVGSVGGAISGAASAVMSPIGNSSDLVREMIQSEEVMDITQLELRALGIQPEEVDELAVGVVSRLISGNTEGAKNYIASRTNIDPNAAEARLNQLRDTITARAQEAASQAASMFSAASWFMFFLLTLSTISAIVGGVMGSKRNAKASLERIEMQGSNYAA